LFVTFCQFLSKRRRLAVNYCGIDLGGVSSYVYVTTDRGRKLWSGPVETSKEALEARLRRFRREGLSVAIEAGNQTAWVYEVLVAMGAEVTVVNPNKVKLIAESRRKTDKVYWPRKTGPRRKLDCRVG
jgi:transposase